MELHSPAPVAESTPIDVETIWATIDAVLGESAQLPRYEEIEEFILRLRGHMMLLIPEIEDRARVLPKDAPARGWALAGVAEAQRKLRCTAGPGLVSAIRHTQQLARSCRALVRHYVRLAGPAAACEGAE